MVDEFQEVNPHPLVGFLVTVGGRGGDGWSEPMRRHYMMGTALEVLFISTKLRFMHAEVWWIG